MKAIVFVVKWTTLPFWGPIWVQLWLIKKCWRFLALAFLVSLIDGCAHTSNRFEKSPCACDFRPINATGNLFEEKKNA